jgi:hypothetical protein
MNRQDATEPMTAATPTACLVEGCPCKDARIVSPRRAAYFASIARARGETADRTVASDPSWAIPVAAGVDPALDAAA